MSQRKEKVTQQIKEIVSEILHDEIRDPRIGFLTVTKVEISNDLQFARIFFSILGSPEQKQQAKEGLESAKKHIRHLLGERLKIRYTPEICFKLDESCEYSIHIEQIFEQLKKEKNKTLVEPKIEDKIKAPIKRKANSDKRRNPGKSKKI